MTVPTAAQAGVPAAAGPSGPQMILGSGAPVTSGLRREIMQEMHDVMPDSCEPAGPSGHENSDEGQQEHQNRTGHRQHDRHQRNDLFHFVGRGLDIAVLGR